MLRCRNPEFRRISDEKEALVKAAVAQAGWANMLLRNLVSYTPCWTCTRCWDSRLPAARARQHLEEKYAPASFAVLLEMLNGRM